MNTRKPADQLMRAVLWLFAILTVAPFALLVLTSLKSREDLLAGAFVLPARPHFENYVSAWVDGLFGTYFLNSVIVVVPVIVLSVVLGTLCGFAFAFLKLPGKPLLFGMLLVGMMVPTEAFIIPLYYEFRWLGLINTYWALILPQVGMSIPFVTLFMTSAMRQLPKDLVDAAVADGASPFRVLRYVIVPLLGPAASTMTLFLFIWTWNEFMIPLILVQDDARRTLPIGMLFFQGKYTIDIPILTAGAVITLLPIIIVYFFFQRKFIQGLTAGAVK
ncbi:MAG TPA: carbohydrate ABC transporter permease [Albidovulum sp.]|uniref:carbohydrate ABC transporter permease n=1 Tax=Albidovulum sp. TaxID=1872424 RepID=UPI002BE084A9|nr:carbohydrate ABC transporter permease [Albidovulum sp.]